MKPTEIISNLENLKNFIYKPTKTELNAIREAINILKRKFPSKLKRYYNYHIGAMYGKLAPKKDIINDIEITINLLRNE